MKKNNPIAMLKLLSCALLALVMVGCASHSQQLYSPLERERLLGLILGAESVAGSEQAVGQDPARFEPEQVTLALDDEIKTVLDANIDPDWHSQRKLRALRKLLFHEDELAIVYDASVSRTASQAFHERRGNCLSMTNLFVAAGRYVGIDANYQTVVVKPTWDHEGWTMIRYEHIVAHGEVAGDDYVVDFLPEFLIGDQPTEEISDLEALGLYYNNLGAEAVVDDKPLEAIHHFRFALAISPDHSDSWSNMGAALRRAGRYEEAEFAYHEALRLETYNYSALSNLAQLYQTMGREEEAKDIEQQVLRYRRRNPYFYFFLAKVLFQEGRFDDSVVFLQNSIRLKRDEPEFYEALAMSYEQLGADREVEEQLALAEKYRSTTQIGRDVPQRIMNHRFWVRRNM